MFTMASFENLHFTYLDMDIHMCINSIKESIILHLLARFRFWLPIANNNDDLCREYLENPLYLQRGYNKVAFRKKNSVFRRTRTVGLRAAAFYAIVCYRSTTDVSTQVMNF